MKVRIYCLYNPMTLEVRYIGRTKSELKVRLSQHISKARHAKKYYPNKNLSHKENWILNLLKLGLKPKIRLLCVIDGWSESHVFEKQLIQKHLEKHNLVNGDDRGPGSTGAKSINPETEAVRVSKIKEFFKHDENKSNFYNKVYAYDVDGNFVKEYKSLSFLVKELNLDYTKVQNQMHQKRKPINGYYYSNTKYEKYPYLKSKYDLNRTYLIIDNQEFLVCDFQKLHNLSNWDKRSFSNFKFTSKVKELLKNKHLVIIKKGTAVLERNF